MSVGHNAPFIISIAWGGGGKRYKTKKITIHPSYQLALPFSVSINEISRE